MMMMSKTIEELEKELHNAKSSLSYHKNKGKAKTKRRRGQSPKAREYALAQQIAWNDEKRAMAHVIAKLTTTNDEDYKSTRNQAYCMPIEEVRSLAKGHEKAVAEDVRQRQEERRRKEKKKEAAQLPLDRLGEYAIPVPVKKVIPKSPTPNYQVGRDSEETSTAVPVKTTTLRLAVEVVSELTGFEGLSDEQVVGHILCRYLQYNKEKKL
jgi:hypothetical protein